MPYFLVRPNNQLQHLPDFRLFRAEQTFGHVDTIEQSFRIPNRKEPDHFTCACPAGDLPSPFLVVDDQAQVFDLAANLANIGSGGFIVTGIVLREYPAPHKEEALKAITEAIKTIPK